LIANFLLILQSIDEDGLRADSSSQFEAGTNPPMANGGSVQGDQRYDGGEQEVQDLDDRPEPEYTREPSVRLSSAHGFEDANATASKEPYQRSLSRSSSGQNWGAATADEGRTVPTDRQRANSGRDWQETSARPPLSRSQSRSATPPQQQQNQYEDELAQGNLQRSGSFRMPDTFASPESSSSFRQPPRPASYAGSPTGSSSTKQPFAPEGGVPPAVPPRPVTLGRQGSFLGSHGAHVATPPPPAPVVPPAAAARPLSTKLDAISSKEYIKRNSLQMKSPAEIAEMKRDLDFCLKELQHASRRIEDLEFHNRNMESEVSCYCHGALFLSQR
jgi:hypothetical protein